MCRHQGRRLVDENEVFEDGAFEAWLLFPFHREHV
jgi:hypothetical protein